MAFVCAADDARSLIWLTDDSQLGAEDFKQIDEAISAATPWLVIADWPERHRPDDLPVTVFFEADITTPDLRKGSATTVSGIPVSANGSRPQRKWEVFPVAMRYAQVPTADGTSWQMTDDGDLDRPFTIGEVRAAGQLADRDIVSLVRFIRQSQAVNGAWPIGDMTLIAPGTVRVVLLDVDAARRSGQEAIIRVEDGGWVVAAVGLWAI